MTGKKLWLAVNLAVANFLTVAGAVLLAMSVKSLYEALVVYQSFDFMTIVYTTFAEIFALIIISLGTLYVGLRMLRSLKHVKKLD
jgi:hypothetical protein